MSIEPTERGSSAATLAAWLWVVVMLFTYLVQFADYVRPILAVLGVAGLG